MASESAILAVCLKAAREAAEKVARSIVPERGPAGRDGRDGINGKDGRNGLDGIDGKDGIGRDGRNGKDGKPGRDGATWFLVYGEPDYGLGKGGDFALDGTNSNVYHKDGNEWEFVVHLKAETPQMMMQAPRAYSPAQIQEIANVTVEAAESYHVIDEDSANDVKYYGFGKEDGQGHYIERVDTTTNPITYRVAVPVADYATDWTNRASLTYARRTEVDIP